MEDLTARIYHKASLMILTAAVKEVEKGRYNFLFCTQTYAIKTITQHVLVSQSYSCPENNTTHFVCLRRT